MSPPGLPDPAVLAALTDALGWTVAVLAAVAAATVAANVLLWPRLRPTKRLAPPDEVPAVSVLIPARDEETTLPGCLASVLEGQTVEGPEGQPVEPVVEVLVYDDRSEDATAAVVRQVAARDARVRLVAGGPLPDGWCGKPHALARLAEEAEGDLLLFLDADARLRPGGVAAAALAARRARVDLLAPWPGLELSTVAERLLMPMLGFVVLTLFPTPLQRLRRDPALGLAHGATILVDARSYRAMGGHGAVADEIFEDTALARAMRRHGGSTLCLDGQEVTRVRMYGSAGEIWRGFTKNFYPAFRHRASFWLFLAGHGMVFLLPFLVAPVALGVPALAAAPWLLAAGLVWGARLALALRFGTPLWSVLAHPLAEAVLLGVGLASWWRMTAGRGVEWKGRVYGGRRPGSGVAR